MKEKAQWISLKSKTTFDWDNSGSKLPNNKDRDFNEHIQSSA